MLTKVRLKNFKSFKEETIIDIEATKYSMLLETNTAQGVTKGLMFAGGNATGKTNAILSISVLLDLLFANAYINMAANFCAFSKDTSMILEYTFKIDNDEIVYFLEFARDGTLSKETLTRNNETMLNRIGLSAESYLTENKIYDQLNVEKRTPFLKVIYFNTKFTKHPTLAKWFVFLHNSIYFNVQRAAYAQEVLAFNKNNTVNIYQYLEKSGTDEINNFFDLYNFNQSISYDPIVAPIGGAAISLREKEIYFQRSYLKNIKMPVLFESLGNQTLLQMLPALLHAVKNDCMFIVDEFNSAFHNDLEELIVKYFMQESKRSQMFFVSHSTNLMKSTLLRPDQIYTVDFYDSKGTKIKRVSSERPRESQNFEKMYLAGVFDGLPNYEKKDGN